MRCVLVVSSRFEVSVISPSVTKILVDWNQLGDEGTTNLCDALRESTVSKVQELSLIGNTALVLTARRRSQPSAPSAPP